MVWLKWNIIYGIKGITIHKMVFTQVFEYKLYFSSRAIYKNWEMTDLRRNCDFSDYKEFKWG